MVFYKIGYKGTTKITYMQIFTHFFAYVKNLL